MRFRIAALCVVLLAGGIASLYGQSPLGEVARQEEERRKTIKAESRVYTNKDLPTVPPPSQAPGALTAVPDGSNAAQDATPADAEPEEEEDADATPRDQAYWSGRMTTLRETVARNQTYADALQSRINALTTDFVNRDDPLQRAAIASDRDRAVAELERLRKQLVADEQAISDVQSEARRAGVPAGWLR